MIILGFNASKFDKKQNSLLLAHIMHIAHFFNLYRADMRLISCKWVTYDSGLIVFLNLTVVWEGMKWETANVTNALQMPYERCKCFRMPYQRYQWLANAYEN